MALLCIIKSDHSEVDLYLAQLYPDVGRTGYTAKESTHCDNAI